MTTIKIPDMESVKKIFEVESEITQIELQHICEGCTELTENPNGQPFCAADRCVKEFYKDDYLVYQDDELTEMRKKRKERRE